MKTKNILKVLCAAGLLAAASCQADVIATFDDLAAPPPLNSASGLQWVNGLNYAGALWDDRFGVVGDEYRVGGSGGPLFGIPHSGHYFVSNADGSSGLTITTDQLLTGAWFGRNEYYGFGAGADQITIVALSGATELGSVVFDLPETHPGEPEPLSFVDTSSFGSYGGITGYRIDRHMLGTLSGNWVADDFQFTDARNAVPEPASISMLALGIFLVYRRTRRT